MAFMLTGILMPMQSYLTSFFREVSSQNVGNFRDIYSTLKPEEQHQLSLLGSS